MCEHVLGHHVAGYRLGEVYGDDRGRIAAKRKEVLARYYAQVRCVFLKLEALLDGLAARSGIGMPS